MGIIWLHYSAGVAGAGPLSSIRAPVLPTTPFNVFFWGVRFPSLRSSVGVAGAVPRATGFMIGDGAGVGKGRQLAGIILDAWMQGHKRHVWLSISPDLCGDSERDLRYSMLYRKCFFVLFCFTHNPLRHENQGTFFTEGEKGLQL